MSGRFGCNMTNMNFFTKFNPNYSDVVTLADGTPSIAEGIGDGILTCICGDNIIRKIVMKNVLYVSKLNSSLLAVRKLTKIGFEVKFLGDNCSISKEGTCVATGSSHNNLYILDCYRQNYIEKNQIRQSIIKKVESSKVSDIEISLFDDDVEANVAKVNNVGEIGEIDDEIIVNEDSGDDTIVDDNELEDPGNEINFIELMPDMLIRNTDESHEQVNGNSRKSERFNKGKPPDRLSNL